MAKKKLDKMVKTAKCCDKEENKRDVGIYMTLMKYFKLKK